MNVFIRDAKYIATESISPSAGSRYNSDMSQPEEESGSRPEVGCVGDHWTSNTKASHTGRQPTINSTPLTFVSETGFGANDNRAIRSRAAIVGWSKSGRKRPEDEGGARRPKRRRKHLPSQTYELNPPQQPIPETVGVVFTPVVNPVSGSSSSTSSPSLSTPEFSGTMNPHHALLLPSSTKGFRPSSRATEVLGDSDPDKDNNEERSVATRCIDSASLPEPSSSSSEIALQEQLPIYNIMKSHNNQSGEFPISWRHVYNSLLARSELLIHPDVVSSDHATIC